MVVRYFVHMHDVFIKDLFSRLGFSVHSYNNIHFRCMLLINMLLSIMTVVKVVYACIHAK